MKFLFVLNILLLVAAVVLGDIVLGSCAFIGLSGFAAHVGHKLKTKSANAVLIH